MQLPRYAIFDMDGTLIDSTGMWERVSDRVLARWGKAFPQSDRERTLTLTVEGTAEFFVREYALPATADEVAQALRGEAARGYREEAAVKVGAETVLRELSARGVQMCVASGTEKPLMDAALERLGLLRYFRFTTACKDALGKAAPTVYLEAMRRLGAPAPAAVMVFEDSPVALRIAKRAGFFTVAVRDEPLADAWAGMAADADLLCPSWPEWLAAIEKTTNED